MSSSAITVVPASRTRRTFAGLIDSAPTLALLGWRLWRRAGEEGGSRGRESWQRWLQIVGPQSAAVHEQLGTPGEWIMGLRTVDRRTGQRVAPWRTAVLAGAQAAAVMLRVRLTPPPASAEERRAAVRELTMLRERHADDPEALRDATERHHREHHVNAHVARPFLVGLALNLANRELRKRLAPTVVIRARGA